RPLVDANVIALLEGVLRLRFLRRRLDLLKNLLDLFLAERRRLAAGPDKAGDLRRVLDDMPRVVGHVHLDQDVAGEEPFRRHDLPAAAHLDDIFGWNENLTDLVLQAVRLDALRERLRDLFREAR